MTEFDSTLNALQAKNQSLQNNYAQTMAKIEINKQRYIDALEDLKRQGCDSVEQAEEVIAQLSAEIERELESIVEELQ